MADLLNLSTQQLNDLIPTSSESGPAAGVSLDAASAQANFSAPGQVTPGIGSRDSGFGMSMMLAPGAAMLGSNALAAPQVTVETSSAALAACACAACSNAPSEQGTGAVEVKTETGVWDPVSFGNPLPGNVFVAGLAGTSKWSKDRRQFSPMRSRTARFQITTITPPIRLH